MNRHSSAQTDFQVAAIILKLTSDESNYGMTVRDLIRKAEQLVHEAKKDRPDGLKANDYEDD